MTDTRTRLPDLNEAGGPFAGTILPLDATGNGKQDKQDRQDNPSDQRFIEASLTAAELADFEFPQPRELLGGRLLRAGDWTVLYGKPKTGKTWLAGQLAVCLAEGRDFLGLAVPPEGVRVGILELELARRCDAG